MLSYLQGSTRPEISISIHQCAPFLNNPHLVHERAIRRIANYLVSMSTYVYLLDGNWRLSTRGIFYRTNIEKGINFYVDSEFASGWAQVDADNTENFIEYTGYVIMYVGCKLLWYSRLQPKIALIATEAEYTALSQVMC